MSLRKCLGLGAKVDYLNLKERNKNIINAIKDGYKQSEIGRYLGLSSAGVSYILNSGALKKQGLK